MLAELGGLATPTYWMPSPDIVVRELKSSWVPLVAAASGSGARPRRGVLGFAHFLCWAAGDGGAWVHPAMCVAAAAAFPERKLVG